MYLDLDLNLVHINMQNYPVIGELSEADWLDPLLTSLVDNKIWREYK